MNDINEALISEIRILFIAEECEFPVERAIINELVYPNLKKYFANELNVEFNLIDVHQETNCKNIPIIDKSQFLLSEIRKCQRVSAGLSSIILIGDSYGQLKAPKSLSVDQYMHVLTFLQSKNDPSWIIFKSKYTENSKKKSFLLDENTGKEEICSILNSIDAAIESAKDLFPANFNDENFRSDLDRCVNAATVKSSTTQIIHRLPAATKKPKDINPQENDCVKSKYEALVRLINKNFPQENYLKYSVSGEILAGAQRDITNDNNKLTKIVEMCNFSTNKCRQLTKDLRTTSSSDVYLQIFTENIIKVIRESCYSILVKKEFSKILSHQEILSHKTVKNISSFQDLENIIDKTREREQNLFSRYLTSISVSPCLYFGAVGSGKSTLLTKFLDSVSSNHVLIMRRCGKTSCSSSLQLILSSISQQINSSFSKADKQLQYSEYAVCVYEFWLSLNKATQQKPVVILLDDVDKLFPTSHTDMLKWLPHSLPNFVKILFTSSSDSFYQGFKRRYDETNIVNLLTIDPKEVIKLFGASVSLNKEKSISESVLKQANFILQENSTPLFFTLLLWNIDFVEDPEMLSNDVKSLAKIYLKKLEMINGSLLLTHIFAYLSLSRYGLSLSELVDILSLDNRVCQSIQFDFLCQKSFKFPIYIVVNILESCKNLLEYVQTSHRLLIRLKHSVYCDAIKDSFNLLKEDGMYFFQNLYDYWISKYENDRLKSILDKISDDDESSSETSHIYIKRKITPQPYYSMSKLRKISSNERKLLELPFILVSFDKFNELYRTVLFNFEYLFAVLNHFGMNHLLVEIYFCRQLNEIKNSSEVELLLIQLRLLPKAVISDAQLLSSELTGRLSHFIGNNSMLAYLHQHIDSVASKINVLTSVIPSYLTIDVENMCVETGAHTEIISSTLSLDNRFISTIHCEKKSQEYILIVWDSYTATKTQIINLGNFKDTKISNIVCVPQREELLIVKFDNPKNKGFYIINLEFSYIEKVINFPIKNIIKVEYISKSHLYLLVDNEIQVLSIPSGDKDRNLIQSLWPTILTPNDKYQIGPKTPTKKDLLENNINFNLRVMNVGSGETVCYLLLNFSPSYLLANVRNETLFVSTKIHGIIYKFDISQIVKKDFKRLKCQSQFKITEQSLNNDVREAIMKYYPNIKGEKLQLSVDEKHLLSEYSLSDSIRIVAVWNVVSKSIVFCHQMSHSASVSFSTDGQYFWNYVKNETLQVLNLSNGTLHILELEDPPNNIFMLRSGSFFMTYPNSVKLKTLKNLVKRNKLIESGTEFQPESFHISLPQPKVSEENVIVFSNNEKTSKFLYYELSSNSISSLDLSHSNDNLTEFAVDRILSPNGEKLLLIYKFKLAEILNQQKDLEIDDLMLKQNKNGFIISSNNGYRKPQIPKENYFLGKISGENNNKKKLENDPYDQKIVKVIDLKTSGTILQLSIIGEKILTLTDNLLLTFRPDFASLTRKQEDAFDIINVYHIEDRKLVSSLFIEHSVVHSILMPQEKDKLLICCGKNGGILKILGGEYFSTVLLEIDIQSILKYYDESARLSLITKLLVFKEANHCVLVQFSRLEYNTGSVKSENTHYAKIDLVKKDLICQFVSLGQVVDISRDGSLAIDSLLNVYELQKGNIIRKLQSSIGYNNENNCFFSCLFSNDNSYVVVLDNIRENLWVVANDEQGFVNGRALLTPSITRNHPNKHFDMCLLLDGRLIVVYSDDEFKLFNIRMNSKSTVSDLSYKSTSDRIKKLLYLT